MKINEIIKELESIKKIYKEVILSSNYKIIDSSISWSNYQTGIPKILYAKEYEMLVANRQYSFLLTDKNGFVQFYYEYSAEQELKKIKMAYYPFPIELKLEREELDTYFNDNDDPIIGEYYYDLWSLLNHEFASKNSNERIQEIERKLREELGAEIDAEILLNTIFNLKYKITNTSHIRLDYDYKVDSHNKCEFQIGAINKIRFPIDRILTPMTFFDFIVKSLGKGIHENLVKKRRYLEYYLFSKKKCNIVNEFKESNIYLTHLDD